MHLCKIRKIEWDATRKWEHRYSTDELKAIIKMAITGHRISTEQEHKFTNNARENYSIEWNDILSYIVRLGLNPNSIFPEKSKLLWDMLDDVEIASMLIKSGVDLRGRKFGDQTNSTFLQVVSTSTEPKMHELGLLMIEHGADLSDFNAYGKTALDAAVESGALSIVEAILKTFRYDTSKFWFNFSYMNSLTMAVWSPKANELMELFRRYLYHHDIVRYCCKAISDNMTEDHIKRVLEMISQGEQMHDYESILQCAYDRSIELAKSLICYRTKEKKRLIDPKALLSYNFVLKDPVMIAFAIKEGANINDRYEYANYEQKFPLHLVCNGSIFTHSPKTVRLLLQLGADINVTDRYLETPLSLCIWHHRYEKTKILIVKRFAYLNTVGEKISKIDLCNIRRRSELRQFYDECIGELEKLKMIEITDSLSCFNLLNKNWLGLSLLARNYEVLKILRKSLRQLKPESFPIFKTDLQHKLMIAIKMRETVNSKERELENLFSGILPNIVVRNIALYFVDLFDLERSYYVTCFNRKI